jgi:hypothetical protein
MEWVAGLVLPVVVVLVLPVVVVLVLPVMLVLHEATVGTDTSMV